LIFREKNPKETKSLLPIPSPSPASVILLFGLSVFIIMIFANWFGIFELLAMLMVLGFALFLTVVHIFRNRQQPVYRITYVLLLAVPVIYIGFSFTRLQSDSTQIRKTMSVGVGYSSGNFENRGRKYEGEDENCGPYYSSTYFRQRYSLKGVQFNLKYDYLEKNYSTNFGLNIYGGIHSEKPLDNNLRNVWNDYNIFVVNPSFRFDKEWFGAGVGIHIGNMSYVTYNSKANSGESARKLMNYYSMFSYRIGPKNILYCEYRLADWFPSAFPSYRHQFSIGSGFGSTNGFDVKVGTTFQWIYISSEIPIKNRFTVTPLLLFNKSFNGDDQTQFSMALKYAFIRKEIKVPVAQNH